MTIEQLNIHLRIQYLCKAAPSNHGSSASIASTWRTNCQLESC
ncbi:hypothetical protein [Chromobacterium phragmitis]|uniref:Uncharacterized protein n=1 Tax=Chromobacterium phragmitis TaxID=2202141 RepID=A0ABV0IPD7_9NEIS